VRPPRVRDVLPAAAAIGNALAFHGIDDEVRANQVLTEWADLVGPRIGSRTRPAEVKQRVLIVEVATSAWLHELNLLRPQLLASLLERVGAPKPFDDMKLVLAGRRRAERLVSTVARARPPARIVPTPATGAAREQIVREVERVDDAELRELIARVRIENDR
jgi:predicted nucleic acid-binding Zn ribbon protein